MKIGLRLSCYLLGCLAIGITAGLGVDQLTNALWSKLFPR